MLGINEVANDIPNDVIEYIANNFDSDIRKLESALRKIIVYAEFNPELKNKVIDENIANIALDTLKIDEYGLDSTDRALLKLIIEKMSVFNCIYNGPTPAEVFDITRIEQKKRILSWLWFRFIDPDFQKDFDLTAFDYTK